MLAEGETLAQHAVLSSQRALEMAEVEATDLDLILLATSSPDDIFGSACEACPTHWAGSSSAEHPIIPRMSAKARSSAAGMQRGMSMGVTAECCLDAPPFLVC